jgi:regulator of nucleoside diphosphate kinase
MEMKAGGGARPFANQTRNREMSTPMINAQNIAPPDGGLLNDAAYADPPVVLDAAYVGTLLRFASAAMARTPEVADRLLQEIERARVLPTDELPKQVVNIGSEVTFREDANGREQTVTLVLPPDADISAGRVSVVTPIGAALIGLAQGSSIRWQARDGETREMTIVRVNT